MIADLVGPFCGTEFTELPNESLLDHGKEMLSKDIMLSTSRNLDTGCNHNGRVSIKFAKYDNCFLHHITFTCGEAV